MRRLFALLLLILLTAGLVAAPSAQASTNRWYLCYGSNVGGCVPHAVWSNRSPTWYVPYPVGSGNSLTFQADCNLVVYSALPHRAIWASNTSFAIRPCSLQWQSDGNIVIYDGYGVADWSTHTAWGAGWRYEMSLWSDNCLKVYQAYTLRWTDGHC